VASAIRSLHESSAKWPRRRVCLELETLTLLSGENDGLNASSTIKSAPVAWSQGLGEMVAADVFRWAERKDFAPPCWT